jgi:hypothetical protein
MEIESMAKFIARLLVSTQGGAVDQKADLKGILFMRLAAIGFKMTAVSEDKLWAVNYEYEVDSKTDVKELTKQLIGHLKRPCLVSVQLFVLDPVATIGYSYDPETGEYSAV